jgi:phosphatidate cytidylyltransferase
MDDPVTKLPEPPDPKRSQMPFALNELQLRIVSGFVAALIALLFVYWGSIPFAILVFLAAAIMSWEWGGIVRDSGADTVAILHIVAIAAAALLANLGMAGLALAAVAVGAISVAALLFGQNSAPLSSAGVFYTGLPVVALGWLRGDDAFGFQSVLFILIIVAATDTAAYISGRLLGGPKLWPAVSPKKTWAGLLGGMFAAAIAGAIFSRFLGSGSAAWLAALGIVLAVIAQGGDLLESALKRRFGRKDSSQLIPGHGGFMDRMDGLVTASVAAALLALAIDAYAPARALLYGE